MLFLPKIGTKIAECKFKKKCGTPNCEKIHYKLLHFGKYVNLVVAHTLGDYGIEVLYWQTPPENGASNININNNV